MPRNPHDFVRLVAKHYRLLTAMCRDNHRFASDAEMESFIRPFVDAGTNVAMVVGRMKDLGVVAQTTGDWAPPPFLGRFLAELHQRHALASPGVVRGWVEKLGGLAQRLEALSAGGIPAGADGQLELTGVLDEITDTLSTIAATVGGNCDRIGTEVAHYRAEEDARQMRFRLARLIDLHSNYLEPVLRLIDIGGDFYSVSEQVLSSCGRLTSRVDPFSGEHLSIAAATVARDVVWLRRGTLRRAHEANRELGPLCEAATRESAIARGVNRALEAISADAWPRLDLDRALQVVSAPDGPLLNDRAAGGYLIAVRSYREVPPPLLQPDEPTSMEVPWSAARLREELEQQPSVADVLKWICDRVGREAPDTPAGLLHDLVEAAPECLTAGTTDQRYRFSRVDVEARVWSWQEMANA